jgi:hypothetical protein
MGLLTLICQTDLSRNIDIEIFTLLPYFNLNFFGQIGNAFAIGNKVGFFHHFPLLLRLNH